MALYLQGIAAALIALLACLVLDRQGKDFSLMIGLLLCAGMMGLAAAFLEPVLDFLRELEDIAGLEDTILRTLFKITGIGILSELAGTLCADAGHGSITKALQLLASAVILWLSIPIFREMLGLLREILGEL